MINKGIQIGTLDMVSEEILNIYQSYTDLNDAPYEDSNRNSRSKILIFSFKVEKSQGSSQRNRKVFNSLEYPKVHLIVEFDMKDTEVFLALSRVMFYTFIDNNIYCDQSFGFKTEFLNKDIRSFYNELCSWENVNGVYRLDLIKSFLTIEPYYTN